MAFGPPRRKKRHNELQKKKLTSKYCPIINWTCFSSWRLTKPRACLVDVSLEKAHIHTQIERKAVFVNRLNRRRSVDRPQSPPSKCNSLQLQQVHVKLKFNRREPLSPLQGGYTNHFNSGRTLNCNQPSIRHRTFFNP
jgi:hypothetical protein